MALKTWCTLSASPGQLRKYKRTWAHKIRPVKALDIVTVMQGPATALGTVSDLVYNNDKFVVMSLERFPQPAATAAGCDAAAVSAATALACSANAFPALLVF